MATENIGLSLPKAFVNIIDEIIEKNPDFKNRVNVIRFAVRKCYDELLKLEKVCDKEGSY